MKKKHKLFVIIIASLFLYNCKNKQQLETNPRWDYENINALGTRKPYTYTFCGIVPKEITSSYKVGVWYFYTQKKVKVAEGTFDVAYREIDDYGGCSYFVYENSIDATKWKFWDSNGKSIPTNKRDLDYILSK